MSLQQPAKCYPCAVQEPCTGSCLGRGVVATAAEKSSNSHSAAVLIHKICTDSLHSSKPGATRNPLEDFVLQSTQSIFACAVEILWPRLAVLSQAEQTQCEDPVHTPPALSDFFWQHDIDSGRGNFLQNCSSYINFITNQLPEWRNIINLIIKKHIKHLYLLATHPRLHHIIF